MVDLIEFIRPILDNDVRERERDSRFKIERFKRKRFKRERESRERESESLRERERQRERETHNITFSNTVPPVSLVSRCTYCDPLVLGISTVGHL